MTLHNAPKTAQEGQQGPQRTDPLPTPSEASKTPPKPRDEPRDVCPYCKYETEIYLVFCNGHTFETHRCREHGDVVPMRSAVAHLHQEIPSRVSSEIPIRSGDAIVDETIALLLKRSQLGQEKYGTTLMRNDLDLRDWLYHAIEESLDRTLYMLRALKDLEQLYDDGR